MSRFSIIFLLFLLSGCSNVKYIVMMPHRANQVNSFPSSMLGEYISISHTQSSINGYFYKTYQDSTGSYFIEERKAIQIDSLNWTKRNLGLITSIDARNNYLEILTKNEAYYWYYADSIQNQEIEDKYEIDLVNSLFHTVEGERREELGEAGSKCRLLIEEGKYYLNINSVKNRWNVIRLVEEHDRLLLDNVGFHPIALNAKETFSRDTLYKYGLSKPTWSDSYIGNSTNKLMYNLIERNKNSQTTWYKIDSRRSNWTLVPIGLISILLSLVFLKEILR